MTIKTIKNHGFRAMQSCPWCKWTSPKLARGANGILGAPLQANATFYWWRPDPVWQLVVEENEKVINVSEHQLWQIPTDLEEVIYAIVDRADVTSHGLIDLVYVPDDYLRVVDVEHEGRI